MDAGTIERIETNVERAAAGVFAAAVAFATFMALRSDLPPPQADASAAAGALLAYLLSARAMATVTPRRAPFRLRVFDVRELEPAECDELLLTDRLADELVLTDADRLESPAVAAQEPLLLEDALPHCADDSRVVRLFDRRPIPAPGELKTLIDEHLAGRSPSAQPSDASKALADALAQLRRSLR